MSALEKSEFFIEEFSLEGENYSEQEVFLEQDGSSLEDELAMLYDENFNLNYQTSSPELQANEAKNEINWFSLKDIYENFSSAAAGTSKTRRNDDKKTEIQKIEQGSDQGDELLDSVDCLVMSRVKNEVKVKVKEDLYVYLDLDLFPDENVKIGQSYSYQVRKRPDGYRYQKVTALKSTPNEEHLRQLDEILSQIKYK